MKSTDHNTGQGSSSATHAPEILRKMTTKLSCIRYRRALSAYLDGRLGPEKNSAVARHLSRCHSCRQTLKQLRELGTALTALAPPPEAPANLHARIMARARTHNHGAVLPPKKQWGIDISSFFWSGRAATVTALLAGLIIGSLLGWSTGADRRTPALEGGQHDLYALEVFSGAPQGSVEAAALALRWERP